MLPHKLLNNGVRVLDSHNRWHVMIDGWCFNLSNMSCSIPPLWFGPERRFNDGMWNESGYIIKDPDTYIIAISSAILPNKWLDSKYNNFDIIWKYNDTEQ